MKTIAQLNAELEAAEALVRKLREERAALLVEKCGLKPGDEFSNGAMRYKVRSVAAASRGSEVWLNCQSWTSTKKWSQGTRIVNHKVED